MAIPLNYRHLHYFWVTTQEGSFTRAAERLGVAVQTVSAQIGLLERSLGATLLSPQGRRLVPTEAGRIALDHANQIFQLGEQLRQAIEDASEKQPLRLTVGISDALPKLIAYRLLSDALVTAGPLRLVCEEGDFQDLVADLALHRLDVVLTDRPAATSGNLRVYSHPLGDCEITLFGAPALAKHHRRQFPFSLDGAPLLLPTRDNALRGRLDQWFSARSLRPRVIGEFEDSALLMTFGRGGLGLFPAPAILAADIAAEYGALPVGNLAEVREQFYAITAERRIRHPAVEALLTQAPDQAISGGKTQR
ncbi:MAG: LysR family transcriptional regulator [Gammaproteobacteria bacterium]|nr:LysR family transcriptional regulator [Gammaproteobacteria bacterium]MBU1415618.1 LysR family transcriptional regulator [Gammaproteobacteria bacterium]